MEEFIDPNYWYTDTLEVAKQFKTRPFNLVRTINNHHEEYCKLGIQEIHYVSRKNNDKTKYLLTRKAFALLMMGINTKKATSWKVNYLLGFDTMHKTINTTEEELKSSLFLDYKLPRESESRTLFTTEEVKLSVDDLAGYRFTSLEQFNRMRGRS